MSDSYHSLASLRYAQGLTAGRLLAQRERERKKNGGRGGKINRWLHNRAVIDRWQQTTAALLLFSAGSLSFTLQPPRLLWTLIHWCGVMHQSMMTSFHWLVMTEVKIETCCDYIYAHLVSYKYIFAFRCLCCVSFVYYVSRWVVVINTFQLFLFHHSF